MFHRSGADYWHTFLRKENLGRCEIWRKIGVAQHSMGNCIRATFFGLDVLWNVFSGMTDLTFPKQKCYENPSIMHLFNMSLNFAVNLMENLEKIAWRFFLKKYVQTNLRNWTLEEGSSRIQWISYFSCDSTSKFQVKLGSHYKYYIRSYPDFKRWEILFPFKSLTYLDRAS